VVGGSAEDPLSEHDQREVDVRQQVAVLGAESLGAEEQAVGLGEPVGEELDLVLAVASELSDDDAQPALGRRRDDGVGQLSEVGLPQLRDRQPDDAGAAGAQAARGMVRSVAQFCTRARVSGCTFGWSFTTLDTVLGETRAMAATSRIVTAIVASCSFVPPVLGQPTSLFSLDAACPFGRSMWRMSRSGLDRV
jgi:hypothetical protein